MDTPWRWMRLFLSFRVSKTSDQSQKFQVIRTSLQGKGDSSLCDILSDLAIEAADSLIDLGDGDDIERMFVKRLQIKEGGVMDSSLERGLMLLKSRVDISTEANSDGGRIAIIDGGLDKQKLEISASIEISSPGLSRISTEDQGRTCESKWITSRQWELICW